MKSQAGSNLNFAGHIRPLPMYTFCSSCANSHKSSNCQLHETSYSMIHLCGMSRADQATDGRDTGGSRGRRGLEGDLQQAWVSFHSAPALRMHQNRWIVRFKQESAQGAASLPRSSYQAASGPQATAPTTRLRPQFSKRPREPLPEGGHPWEGARRGAGGGRLRGTQAAAHPGGYTFSKPPM